MLGNAMDSPPPASHRGIAPPGFRLPAGTHVGGVRLQVADLQHSIDYYERVLGFGLLERTDDHAALGAGARSLVRLQEKRGVRPAPRRGAFGLYHFAVLLPDRPALGRFAAHASRLGLPLGMADHLVSEALYLTDPDGLGIEVYADRPRETWQYEGRELRMATDPLDVQDVLDAGAGQPWTSAPAGTVLGHIHLHVGGLAAAEAFYHAALGFDKTVWSYPGALFLSAGGYHHHLGTNTWSPGPAAADDEARLLEWELVVPDELAAGAAASSLRAAGHAAEATGHGWTAADHWGTRLRIIAQAS